jgi:uncharacterized protein
MSVTSKSIVFLALAFAISWGIAIGGYFSGLRESLGLYGPTVLLVAMMTGPAISAFVCAIAFEKGRRVQALGLSFKPNIWWFWAWLIPIALTYASIGVTLAFTDQTFVDVGAAMRAAAEAQGQDLSQAPPFVLSTAFIVAMAMVLGALINTLILTFTEELGWRGYLYDLWRPAGFWRTALATGLIWGVWHAPAIYLYGHNYPTEPLLGVGIFTLYCVPMAVIITHVRERGGSVWAAGIFHGTFNAVGGLSIAQLSAPDFPWAGIVGIGGIVAVTVGAAIVIMSRMRAPALAAAA